MHIPKRCPFGHPLLGKNLVLLGKARKWRCKTCHRRYMRDYMREWRSSKAKKPKRLIKPKHRP
jgi:NAD-dependent SIR2 family protein deacetylase